jgi:phenylpropionate dioxygenase-like ring-hydroxylating dioxygenase large terminal subunit
MNDVVAPIELTRARSVFPLDRWYVAGFSWELKDKPLARTILSRPMVLFRAENGTVAALQDRCCHRDLPLSCGTVEGEGLRCGYHGMLYNAAGQCVEIPGQDKIPARAVVPSYPLLERDQILWVWVGSSPDAAPRGEPPAYRFHSDAAYKFGGGVYHYDAPWQLIHDNLLDLSHLGYVHLKTIGGNPKIHMNAKLTVTSTEDAVKVLRLMPESDPPPTYTAAWPFNGRIDRWQEVVFHPSHCAIWTGGMDHGSGSYDDPDRAGFHMRGFHGVTPETESSTHYFWTIATNPHPDRADVTKLVVDQTAATFEEDKVIIEAQYQNQCRFGSGSNIDIHVDVGPNRARRIIEKLCTKTAAVQK